MLVGYNLFVTGKKIINSSKQRQLNSSQPGHQHWDSQQGSTVYLYGFFLTCRIFMIETDMCRNEGHSLFA